MTPTLSSLLRQTRERLASADNATSDLDARLIVEHFTGATRTDVITDPQRRIDAGQLAAVEAAIARRLAGEPVHRILGHREFYGLRLALSTETLEPRPDTETLVDAVLPFVRDRLTGKGTCRILDLGTGTGAIALALIHNAAGAEAVGVDISDDALATARANAQANGLDDRFTALNSDWFERIEGHFDVIVSNPPYIRTEVVAELAREVRNFDPIAALDGGADGLVAYRKIAESAGGYLTEGGLIGIEIGFDQQLEVGSLFERRGYKIAGLLKDLGGNDRVILFQKA